MLTAKLNINADVLLIIRFQKNVYIMDSIFTYAKLEQAIDDSLNEQGYPRANA